MLETVEAVKEGLRANDELPYGRRRTVTAEELVEAAEQFDDNELLASALLELMEAYEYDAEQRKAPVVFARILKIWDTDPDAFGDWARAQVFWRFKWVASSLLRVPDVPLEAVRRWHEEMRKRYTDAGFDLQPYYAQRYHLAAHTGVGIQHAFELWATRRRSRFSDCEACETRARAEHFVRAGDDARALEVWKPVLSGDSGCTEEPYASHASALLPLVRQGRLDEARSSHLVGYRFARGRSNMASAVAEHLEFCALTGNQPRGLEILSENRDLFDNQGDPLSRLNLLTAVELLLTRLVDDGHQELAVSGPPGTAWTAGALLELVRTEGTALAARYDARNGTSAVGDWRRARIAQQPLLAEPLALGVRAARLDRPVQAPAPRPAAEPVPEDFTALVVRARELYRIGHPDADPLWQRIAELAAAEGHVHPAEPEFGSAELLRAEIALHRAHVAVDQDRRDDAAADYAEAERLFEAAGAVGRALGARGRTAVVHLGADDGEGGRAAGDPAELDRLVSRAEELFAAGTIDADELMTVLHCRAYAAHHALATAPPDAPAGLAERFEEAVGALRRQAERHGVAHRRATAAQMVADAAARDGRLDEAEAELRQGLELLRGVDQPWRTPRLLLQIGQVTLQQGRPADAVPALHEALAAAVRWSETSFPYGMAYAMLGHACASSGDVEGGIRALSEAAARCDRAGERAEASHLRLQLAGLLRETGRVADAVAVLESALLDAGELEESVAAQLRLDLGRGLFALEEYREAAEVFLRLADTVADWEDQGVHTMVACEATLALAEAEHWEAALAASRRALASHEKAPRGQVLDTLREFARITVARRGAEGLESALGLLADADRLRERIEATGEQFDAWWPIATVHFERARCYAVSGRPEEGLAEAELAVDAYPEGVAEAVEPWADAVRLAAMIEGLELGRTDAALRRIGEAVRRADRAGRADVVEFLGAARARLTQ